ncbi:Uu.00g003360.m01.CDS01 [Anthostomella pinea]|uniref:Uu.00g003360.m01.CDS01 n=1 Tax=Anthostomella pinea TaxID=933095 RepID=A0AAI8VKQ2_9PEZI|nr:Uu.00g003360.m01.CDS01 [Anthostomella pinea]
MNEKREFPIEPKVAAFVLGTFIPSQLFAHPRCPDPSKGEAAKEDIIQSVKGRRDGATAIEVWTLDVSNSQSTLDFATRVTNELPRVDVLLGNAGVNLHGECQVAEGIEMTMQINVLNTFLLALVLLPKLRETKAKFPASVPHLVIVSSDTHRLTKFNEINAPNLYEAFADKSTYTGQARYQDSKLIQVLLMREIVARLKASDPSGSPSPIVFNLVTPGLVISNLERNLGKPRLATRIAHKVFYRTTEVGARTLVHAASAGPDTHGGYLLDYKNVPVESWIDTDMGKKAQLKTYEQTMKILDGRRQGIAAHAGL